MRRKRVSKRRWKARYLLGKPIPYTALFEHRLDFPVTEYIYDTLTCTIRRRPNS